MGATSQNFSMWQGETKAIVFDVVDAAGADKNVTGGSATWVLAPSATDAALITKTSSSGQISLSGNNVTVMLQAVDTALLSGKYYHECRVTLDGDVETIATGYVKIYPSAI